MPSHTHWPYVNTHTHTLTHTMTCSASLISSFSQPVKAACSVDSPFTLTGPAQISLHRITAKPTEFSVETFSQGMAEKPLTPPPTLYVKPSESSLGLVRYQLHYDQ